MKRSPSDMILMAINLGAAVFAAAALGHFAAVLLACLHG
jgi:hypothetical protein